jgi:hypothetical protein
MEVTASFEQMMNNCTQENYIASSAGSNICIRQSRGTRIVWIYMYDFGSTLLCLDYIGEGNRVGFCHVAAHDQYSIAIHKILWKSGGAATS